MNTRRTLRMAAVTIVAVGATVGLSAGAAYARPRTLCAQIAIDMRMDADNAHEARMANDFEMWSFWNDEYVMDWNHYREAGC